MAKKQSKEKKEVKSEEKKYIKSEIDNCIRHYDDAKAELEIRINHKERGFNVYERVYRNYIQPNQWPFEYRVADGRGATLIDRKTDRLLANRLAGRFVPKKYGTELGARIATELILHQWNEIDLVSNTSMLLRWRLMDSRARRFGASFGRWSWKIIKDAKGQVIYDGPWFEPWDNRDVLTQPGARSIEDSEWIILRDYVTLSQLKRVNDSALTGPIYDPDVIKKLSQKDSPETNYQSVDKSVIGLSTSFGDNKRIEICHEYNQATGKWIDFVPKQGGVSKDGYILRSIDNPFENLPAIPVVCLNYYPIDDDIYGKPELENVLPLIKSNWALLSQYLQEAQDEIYTPIMVNPLQAQLDTLEFKSGARWLMNRPGQDVVMLQRPNKAMETFIKTYGLLTSLIMEGVGETAQDISNVAQTFSDKTATEVKDLAMLRTAKDNANKSILAQAIGRMVHSWHKMNQEMMTSSRVIKIVGKEALKYFVNEGLQNWTIKDEGAQLIANYIDENKEIIMATQSEILKQTGERVEPFEIAYETLRQSGELEKYATPLFPVKVGNETLPKLQLEKDGKTGFLHITKDDIVGDYNFIVDVEALSLPNDTTDIQAKQMLFDNMLKVKQDIEAEGYKIKFKELLEKIAETAKIKDAEQYFEKIEGANNTMMPQNPQEMTPPQPQAGGVPQEGETIPQPPQQLPQQPLPVNQQQL